MAEAKQGRKERGEHGGSDTVHCLRGQVGDSVEARGQEGGAGS